MSQRRTPSPGADDGYPIHACYPAALDAGPQRRQRHPAGAGMYRRPGPRALSRALKRAEPQSFSFEKCVVRMEGAVNH